MLRYRAWGLWLQRHLAGGLRQTPGTPGQVSSWAARLPPPASTKEGTVERTARRRSQPSFPVPLRYFSKEDAAKRPKSKEEEEEGKRREEKRAKEEDRLSIRGKSVSGIHTVCVVVR